MRNRTLIGLVCVVLAIFMVFVISPLVNRATTDTVDVLRLKTNVERGTRITTAHIEIASVKKDTVPNGILNNAQDIVGKYAATALFAGDYFSNAKLSATSNTAEDVFADLGGKVAFSIPVSSFAGGLSGKLQNGDIVRLYVKGKEIADDGNGENIVFVPLALQWVRVITTTTGDGIDQNEIHKNEDGTYAMPSTITVLVSDAQAGILAHYAAFSSFQVALVYRGTEEKAAEYLAMQDAVLATIENGGSEYAFGGK